MNRRTPRGGHTQTGRSLIGDQGLAPGNMEPIIAGRDLRKSWGATLVLEHADFLLHAGDKVALVGPNGSGKSTLFRLLAGETAPDLGDLMLKPGLRYGYLPQVPNVPPETVVRDFANAKEKDVLLLDEPTNHMDVDTIETIEGFLQEIDAAVLLASHDKFLLDAIADKVIEIDRLRTLEYVGNYTDYRVQRDAIARAREAQRHRHQAELKRQLAIIEEFKSRKVYEQVLSRNLRVEQMRRETPEPPPTAPRAFRLSFRTGASGPGVVRLEGVAKSHGGRLLFADVDLELAKGDKVGLVGQLSGGGGPRLALAKFIAQDYARLVPDEPTNPLDIESQEIVAAALRTYPGMVLVVSHNRSFLNEVANKIAVIAHRRLAVFQGTFKDSWAAAKMAEFMAVQQRPRYRVLRVGKDWETGTAYHGGGVVSLNRAEDPAFLRLLRWGEADG